MTVKNSRGFTLLEILVSIVLLGLGVAALASLQVSNIKNTGFNKNASIATGLAQKRVETLKNSDFDTIASNSEGVTEQGMTVSWTVDTVGTTPNRYKDVAVTVAWEGQSVSCYTIITEP